MTKSNAAPEIEEGVVDAEQVQEPTQEAQPVEQSDGKQPKYTEEFKQAVVARLQAGESQAAVSRDTGVKTPTLRKWLGSNAGRIAPADTDAGEEAIDPELLAKLEAGKNHPNAKVRAAIEKCYSVLHSVDEAQREAKQKAKQEEEYQRELQALKTKYGKK